MIIEEYDIRIDIPIHLSQTDKKQKEYDGKYRSQKRFDKFSEKMHSNKKRE